MFKDIITGLQNGSVIPYLGAHALVGSTNKLTGEPIPADSNSLILAMNNGQPMAPKLMYEFPRAAMNQELKKGRSYVNKFLTKLYGETQWTPAPLHTWLASLNLPYLIDTNRDTHLQDAYASRPHTLVVGTARLGGTDYRFHLYHFDGAEGSSYKETTLEAVDTSLPVLFKPLGTPRPAANFIASDADYVDYITELMGGFGMPAYLKQYRRNKQYLLLGLPLNRDTERMILSDIIYDAAKPAGWAVIPDANDKEIRFCKKLGFEVINAEVKDLLAEIGIDAPSIRKPLSVAV
ncbi:SIR2 family protein [Beggiatoa leptomitoformis]|uniref:SIR2 family protein n=1 Tax=Beggiatoa leptomitoformis TaxID=288004 RepID=A0A2N9YDQ2_9GAMM|nr:SIR2 family protein [Beggiatoa leptomitoformis]ALG68993.1 SIR2 family protein [Beggiatoa leptomitoformis]AUI68612.1 SIR2 family protein [Beggiatoa leptomitoformis]